MEPMKLLMEEGAPTPFDLPQELSRLYGGSFGLDAPSLSANFVSSVDGVVALPGVPQSSMLISGRSEADRFVMGLLRASADAVLIGAGTLRAAPKSLWTPDFIYPDVAAAFGDLRKRLGRTPSPQLAIVTASGELDPAHPAIRAGALILTTDEGAGGLRKETYGSSQIVALAERGPLDTTDVVEHLRTMGHQTILTEGGPTLIGGLLDAGLLGELFLTVSPVLAGRAKDEQRPGLVDGIDLLPDRGAWSSLLSVRSRADHLFLRYRLVPGGSTRNRFRYRGNRRRHQGARAEGGSPLSCVISPLPATRSRRTSSACSSARFSASRIASSPNGSWGGTGVPIGAPYSEVASSTSASPRNRSSFRPAFSHASDRRPSDG